MSTLSPNQQPTVLFSIYRILTLEHSSKVKVEKLFCIIAQKQKRRLGFSQNSHNCMKVQLAKSRCPKLYHKRIQSLTKGNIPIVHHNSFWLQVKTEWHWLKTKDFWLITSFLLCKPIPGMNYNHIVHSRLEF